MRKLIWFYQINMDWELTDVNMDIPYIVIAYILVFIAAIITVKR